MKKIAGGLISLVLVMVLSFGLVPQIFVQAISGEWSYYKTTVAVGNITITTPEELAGFAANVSAGNTYSGYTVTLGSDIDLSVHYWVPIGTNSNRFQGTFDGAGHSVSGMTISTSTLPFVGLFGAVQSATIKNVNVAGDIASTSSDQVYAGGLTGYAYQTTLTNCNSSVNMTVNTAYNAYVGSLVGKYEVSGSFYIRNCSATGNVSLISTSTSVISSVGGLIGHLNEGNTSYRAYIYDSYATGSVTGSSAKQLNAGGLIGYTYYVDINNCYATGTVSNTADTPDRRIGGFVGCADVSTWIYNSYATGNVTSSGNATVTNIAGGFFGHMSSSGARNSYSTGTVTVGGTSATGTARYGGFVGLASSSNFFNSYYLYNAYSGTTTGYGSASASNSITNLTGLTSGQLTGTNVITDTYTSGTATYNGQYFIDALNKGAGNDYYTKGWLQASGTNGGYPYFTSLWSDPGKYDNTIATQAASNLTITTPAQLAGLAVAVNNGINYSGYTVTLGANINLSANYWTPIGYNVSNYFQGTFNGAGYTISGMNVLSNYQQYSGLFGYLANSATSITNVNLAGNVSSYYNTGAQYSGGLVGYAKNCRILGCNVNVAVNAYSSNQIIGGGLIGKYYGDTANGFVTNCSATGAVNVTSTYTSWNFVGGLIGHSATNGNYTQNVSNSNATGNVNVTCPNYTESGGMVGCTSYTTYTNCYATGSVTNTTAVTTRSIGGFAGTSSTSAIFNNCYATGNITATNSCATTNAAGFIGNLGAAGTVSNCYSVGTVNAYGTTMNAGGFIGKLDGTVTNGYYLYNAFTSSYTGFGTKTTNPTNLTGLTTDQLSNTGNITNTYQTGTGTYNDSTFLTALNTANKAIANARDWNIVSGQNSGYPILVSSTGYWKDAGNYDTTLANAAPDNITITTPQQLAALAVAIDNGKTYNGFTVTIGADIDMSAHLWEPMSSNTTYQFLGSFDGNGHTISGLEIVSNGNQYAGFFGYLSNVNTKITGLTLSGTLNANNNEALYAGGLVGYAINPTITGVTSNIDVTANSSINVYGGSLIGQYQFSGTRYITDCYATGDVSVASASTPWNYAGGLIGLASSTNSTWSYIRNCGATGSVTFSGVAGSRVNQGGLIGEITYTTVTNSYAKGAVSNTTGNNSRRTGGFVGCITTGNIYNSYAEGTVTVSGTTTTDWAGGFAGYNSVAAIISNCYSIGGGTEGGVSAADGTTKYYGGFIGQNASGQAVVNCYYLYNSYNTAPYNGIGNNAGTMTNLTGLTADQFAGTETITNTYGTTTSCTYAGDNILTALNKGGSLGYSSSINERSWLQETDTNDGYPYHIATWADYGNYDLTIASAPASNLTIMTPAQFAGFMVAVNNGINYSGYTVKLGTDLDMSAYNWIPIGFDATNYFRGDFNGENHTISNLKILTTGMPYVGLFGYTNTSGSSINSLNLTGSVEAYCTSNTLYVGGLGGLLNGTRVNGCTSALSVTAWTNTSQFVRAGGLIGQYMCQGADNYLLNSSATGDVNVITAYNSTDSVNVGGLVGFMNSGSTSYRIYANSCFATGAVTASSGSTLREGGLFGRLYYTTATNCYATGAVSSTDSGNDKAVGGFFGINDASSFIYNSFATGSVNSTNAVTNNRVGGFGGINASGDTISNCYSTGAVTGSGGTLLDVASFMGRNSGTLLNDYYLYVSEQPGYGSNTGTITSLTGLTDEQLKNTSNITATNYYSSNSTAQAYLNKPLVDAMNTSTGAITDARSWAVDSTSAINSGYPYMSITSTNWADIGNYDTATAIATPANITITTPAQLAGFGVAVNSGKSYSGYTVTLGADLDMSAYTWMPIGNTSTPFRGTFNGAGHTVSGLNIQTNGTQYAGFFGYTNSATIKDLNVAGDLTSSYIGNDFRVGGLTGWAYNTTLTGCSSSVNVTATGTGTILSGGFIGYYSTNGISPWTINCYSTGSVNSNSTATTGWSYTGGFIGRAVVDNNTTGVNYFKYCYSTGNVTLSSVGYTESGGFLGNGYWMHMYDCYSTGNVAVSGSGITKSIGAFIGTANNAHSYSGYATGNVTETGTNTNNQIGGYIGNNYQSGQHNSYSTGTVSIGTAGTSQNYVGGFVGNNNTSGTITNDYYRADSYSGNTTGYGYNSGSMNSLTGLTSDQLLGNSTITNTYTTGSTAYSGLNLVYALNCGAGNFNYQKAWLQASGTNGGYPYFASNWSELGNYDMSVASAPASNLTINTPQEFAGFMVAVNNGINYSGKTVTLGADLDMSAYYWTPIGFNASNYFRGTFDGGGHTISGLSIKTTGMQYVGLFGYLNTASVSISNVNLEGYVDSYYTGGETYAGGLAGYITNYNITGCNSSMPVTAYSTSGSMYAGGLVGRYYGTTTITMTSCSATGAVTGTSSYASWNYIGGLIGQSDTNSNRTYIINSFATGNVVSLCTVYSNAGGVLGHANYTTLTNCYATGSVTSNTSTTNKRAGGFAGNFGTSSNVYNSYATGDVSAVNNCATSYAGGFAGLNTGGTISNNYSYGSVVGSGVTFYGGAFIGQNSSGTLVNDYYLSSAYSDSTRGYGSNSATITSLTGLTDAQLKNTAVLTNTYTTGTSSYNGSLIVTALNTAAGLITDAKTWTVTEGTNNGYPIYGSAAGDGYWTDNGNFDSAVASATPANITISTPQQLAGLAVAIANGKTYSGYTVTLGADIDMTGHIWIPMSSPSAQFYGTFDGAGHTISGLNIISNGNQYAGFFGYIDSSGVTIKDLNLAGELNATYSSDLFTGGLIGRAYNITITNVSSAVNVTSNGTHGSTGGLIGQYDINVRANKYITNCSATGTVMATMTVASYEHTGGLVGSAKGYDYYDGTNHYYYRPTFDNCWATGNVTGITSYYNEIGGFVGYTWLATYQNCYATGNVTNTTATSERRIGGFAGRADGSVNIYNSYSTGNVVSTSACGTNSAGGFVGYQNGYVFNSYSSGTVTASGATTSYFGGFAGYNSGTLTNDYYLYNAYQYGTTGTGNGGGSLSNLTGLTAAQLAGTSEITNTYTTGAATYNGFYLTKALNAAAATLTFADGWVQKSGTNGGYPYFATYWTEYGNYDTTIATANTSNITITTPAQLAGLAYAVNNNGKTYAGYTVTLGADLDLSAYCWTPIGNATTAFQGSFNGAGYTISGMNVLNIGSKFAGLFGYVNNANAAISDLNVAGTVDAYYMNDYVYAGGLAGRFLGTRITNCTSSVDVNAYGGTFVFAGSMLGQASCSGGDMYITNSSASGTVNGSSTSTSSSYITLVGGFAGNFDSGNTSYRIYVRNCFETGAVTASGGYYINMGGFTGYSYYTTLTNCYATGTVSNTGVGTYRRLGGFVGNSTTSSFIYNSYATGNVTSTGTANSNNVGGMVGFNNGATISNCYSDGTVTASNASAENRNGGFIGYNSSGTLLNCYYLYNAYPISTNGYGVNTGTLTSLTGLTLAQLQNSANITTTYTTGTTSYAGSNVITALNAAGASINSAGKWFVTSGTNNGCPMLGEYLVTFMSPDTTTVYTITGAMSQATISAPTVPTKVGYNFVGWFNEIALTNAWNFATDIVSADTTLFAKFTPAQIEVTFDPNDGTVSPTTQTKLMDSTYGNGSDGTTAEIMPTPTRTGYTFDGWFTGAGGTGTQVLDATSVTNGVAHTLYAKWTVLQCSVTFEENGGSVVTDITQDYGTTINTAPVSTITDQTLSGWYSDSACTTAVTFPYTITEDTTLYALWADTPSFTIAGSTTSPNLRFVDYTTGGTTYHLIRGLNPLSENVSTVASYFNITDGSLKMYSWDYATGTYTPVLSTDTTKKVGTNFKIEVCDSNNAIYATYYVVMLGDATGDGRVTLTDAVAVSKHVSSTKLITDPVALYAVDVNVSSTITMTDVLTISNQVNSTGSITQ